VGKLIDKARAIHALYERTADVWQLVVQAADYTSSLQSFEHRHTFLVELSRLLGHPIRYMSEIPRIETNAEV
jgi:hypothetical protein